MGKRTRDRADPLEPAVGAVLFASDEPVAAKEIALAVGNVKVTEVEAAIDNLEKQLRRHDLGLQLERVAGGVRLATRPEVGRWVRRFFRERNRKRLSLPALETLAIIAYRQPITAPEIQAIRGKDPTPVLKGLLDKKLLRCLGRKRVVGNPLLYGTTREFLLHFGLDALDDLPSVEDFDQFLCALDEQPEELPADGQAPGNSGESPLAATPPPPVPEGTAGA